MFESMRPTDPQEYSSKYAAALFDGALLATSDLLELRCAFLLNSYSAFRRNAPSRNLTDTCFIFKFQRAWLAPRAVAGVASMFVHVQANPA